MKYEVSCSVWIRLHTYRLSCLKPTGLMHEHGLSGCSAMSFIKRLVISEVLGSLRYSVYSAWDWKLSCFHPNACQFGAARRCVAVSNWNNFKNF